MTTAEQIEWITENWGKITFETSPVINSDGIIDTQGTIEHTDTCMGNAELKLIDTTKQNMYCHDTFKCICQNGNVPPEYNVPGTSIIKNMYGNWFENKAHSGISDFDKTLFFSNTANYYWNYKSKYGNYGNAGYGQGTGPGTGDPYVENSGSDARRTPHGYCRYWRPARPENRSESDGTLTLHRCDPWSCHDGYTFVDVELTSFDTEVTDGSIPIIGWKDPFIEREMKLGITFLCTGDAWSSTPRSSPMTEGEANNRMSDLSVSGYQLDGEYGVRSFCEKVRGNCVSGGLIPGTFTWACNEYLWYVQVKGTWTTMETRHYTDGTPYQWETYHFPFNQDVKVAWRNGKCVKKYHAFVTHCTSPKWCKQHKDHAFPPNDAYGMDNYDCDVKKCDECNPGRLLLKGDNTWNKNPDFCISTTQCGKDSTSSFSRSNIYDNTYGTKFAKGQELLSYSQQIRNGIPSCVSNIGTCKCTNGTVSSDYCFQRDGQACVSCNSGYEFGPIYDLDLPSWYPYDKTTGTHSPMFSTTAQYGRCISTCQSYQTRVGYRCVDNKFTCPLGTPNECSGSDCPTTNNEVKCASCNRGWELINDVCTEIECSCSHGTANKGSDNNIPPEKPFSKSSHCYGFNCTKCNTHFNLNDKGECKSTPCKCSVRAQGWNGEDPYFETRSGTVDKSLICTKDEPYGCAYCPGSHRFVKPVKTDKGVECIKCYDGNEGRSVIARNLKEQFLCPDVGIIRTKSAVRKTRRRLLQQSSEITTCSYDFEPVVCEQVDLSNLLPFEGHTHGGGYYQFIDSGVPYDTIDEYGCESVARYTNRSFTRLSVAKEGAQGCTIDENDEISWAVESKGYIENSGTPGDQGRIMTEAECRQYAADFNVTNIHDNTANPPGCIRYRGGGMDAIRWGGQASIGCSHYTDHVCIEIESTYVENTDTAGDKGIIMTFDQCTQYAAGVNLADYRIEHDNTYGCIKIPKYVPRTGFKCLGDSTPGGHVSNGGITHDNCREECDKYEWCVAYASNPGVFCTAYKANGCVSWSGRTDNWGGEYYQKTTTTAGPCDSNGLECIEIEETTPECSNSKKCVEIFTTVEELVYTSLMNGDELDTSIDGFTDNIVYSGEIVYDEDELIHFSSITSNITLFVPQIYRRMQTVQKTLVDNGRNKIYLYANGSMAHAMELPTYEYLHSAHEVRNNSMLVEIGLGVSFLFSQNKFGTFVSRPEQCSRNERILNGACVPCATGTFNNAGDILHHGDTTCDDFEICDRNYFVQNSSCVACSPGTYTAEGDYTGWGDTHCCSLDEKETPPYFDPETNEMKDRGCEACGNKLYAFASVDENEKEVVTCEDCDCDAAEYFCKSNDIDLIEESIAIVHAEPPEHCLTCRAALVFCNQNQKRQMYERLANSTCPV